MALTVPTGQMVGVIGRSGAGKSTLLRMINYMEPKSMVTKVARHRSIGTGLIRT